MERGEMRGQGGRSFSLSSCISLSCVAPSRPVITDLALPSHHGGSEGAEALSVVLLWDEDYSNGKANHRSAMTLA